MSEKKTPFSPEKVRRFNMRHSHNNRKVTRGRKYQYVTATETRVASTKFGPVEYQVDVSRKIRHL